MGTVNTLKHRSTTVQWLTEASHSEPNCLNSGIPSSKAYHLVFAKLGHTAEPTKAMGSLSFFHTTHLSLETTLLCNVHFL